MQVTDSNRHLAQRIREGTLKRQEEQRRVQALRDAYVASVREAGPSSGRGEPAAHLPSILVFLLFLSFPLSEQVVDWMLVAVFCLVHIIYALLASEPAQWLNVLMLVLSDLILIRLSDHLEGLPSLLASLQPRLTAVYLGANLVVAVALYYGYVERRLPWRTSRGGDAAPRKDVPSVAATTPLGSGRRRAGSGAEAVDMAKLAAFVEEAEKAWRTDVASAVFLMGNIAVLTYVGVIPTEAFVYLWRSLMRLIT